MQQNIDSEEIEKGIKDFKQSFKKFNEWQYKYKIMFALRIIGNVTWIIAILLKSYLWAFLLWYAFFPKSEVILKKISPKPKRSNTSN